MPKHKLLESNSPSQPRVELGNKCLLVGKSCWGKRMELELVDKAWVRKKHSSKFS
jgi:hypothetical protein